MLSYKLFAPYYMLFSSYHMQVFCKTSKYCEYILLYKICLCLFVMSLGSNFKNPDIQVSVAFMTHLCVCVLKKKHSLMFLPLSFILYTVIYRLGLLVNLSISYSESIPTLILYNPDSIILCSSSYSKSCVDNSCPHTK